MLVKSKLQSLHTHPVLLEEQSVRHIQMIQRPAERTERFNKPPLYSLSLSFSIPPAMLDSLTFILEKLFFLAHIKVFSLLYVPERRRRRSRSDSERDEDNNNPKTKQHFEGNGISPPQVAPGVGSPPAAHHQHYQRGDLLEVPRTLFTHFGIYLGDGRVAHLIPDVLPALTRGGGPIGPFVTNTRLVLGVLSKQASVRVDSVEDFAYGADVLRNAMDARMIPAAAAVEAAGGPTPPRLVAGEEVAVRAERLVGPVPFYSLLWNNCEHYVTGCRYGDPVSLQTDKFCLWLKALVRDQRNVLRTAFLGVLSMLCLGVSLFTVVPTLLVPFTLWMVS